MENERLDLTCGAYGADTGETDGVLWHRLPRSVWVAFCNCGYRVSAMVSQCVLFVMSAFVDFCRNGNYALVRLPSYTALVSQIQTSDSREIDASKFLAIEAELDSTYPEKWGIFVSKLLPAQKAQLEAVRIQMWIRTMRTVRVHGCEI